MALNASPREPAGRVEKMLPINVFDRPFTRVAAELAAPAILGGCYIYFRGRGITKAIESHATRPTKR